MLLLHQINSQLAWLSSDSLKCRQGFEASFGTKIPGVIQNNSFPQKNMSSCHMQVYCLPKDIELSARRASGHVSSRFLRSLWPTREQLCAESAKKVRCVRSHVKLQDNRPRAIHGGFGPFEQT